MCDKKGAKAWTTHRICLRGHEDWIASAPACGHGPLRTVYLRCPEPACGMMAAYGAVCCMSKEELNADVPADAETVLKARLQTTRIE